MMAIVLSAAMSEGMVSRRDLFLLAVLAMAAAAAAGSQSAWSLVGAPALQMGCSIDAAEAEQSAATA